MDNKNDYTSQVVEDIKNKINSKVLSCIADHNDEPLDFMYAIMNEADLTDEMALYYLWDSFGYKYTEDELKKVIAKYHEEND